MSRCRNHDAGFEARVALEAVKGERTAIQAERKKIKKQTIQHRRLIHQRQAA